MSLCNTCVNKFRRVFIPLKPEIYEDEYGQRVLEQDDNIIITNMCLLTNMDLDAESTILCNKYEELRE